MSNNEMQLTSSFQSSIPYLNAHGLGKPLDDGQQGVGGEHGRLVALGVDDLAGEPGRGGQAPRDPQTLQTRPAGGTARALDHAQHFVPVSSVVHSVRN